MKAELKTKVNDGDVLAFPRGIADERKRADSLAVFKLIRQVTKKAPKMWGAAASASAAITTGIKADEREIGSSPVSHHVNRTSPSMSCPVSSGTLN